MKQKWLSLLRFVCLLETWVASNIAVPCSFPRACSLGKKSNQFVIQLSYKMIFLGKRIWKDFHIHCTSCENFRPFLLRWLFILWSRESKTMKSLSCHAQLHGLPIKTTLGLKYWLYLGLFLVLVHRSSDFLLVIIIFSLTKLFLLRYTLHILALFVDTCYANLWGVVMLT